jgi:hypothetical protein
VKKYLESLKPKFSFMVEPAAYHFPKLSLKQMNNQEASARSLSQDVYTEPLNSRRTVFYTYRGGAVAEDSGPGLISAKFYGYCGEEMNVLIKGEKGVVKSGRDCWRLFLSV